jgi:spore germination protein YaaH
MESFLLLAVVQNHIETTRHCNDKLVQTLVRVPAALGSTGNIVKIINALDLKGYMSPTFNVGEIAPWVTDFGEVDNLAFT